MATSVQILTFLIYHLVLSAGFQSASNAPVPSREPGQLTDGLITDHAIHGKADNKVTARSLWKIDLTLWRTIGISKAGHNLCFPNQSVSKAAQKNSNETASKLRGLGTGCEDEEAQRQDVLGTTAVSWVDCSICIGNIFPERLKSYQIKN